MPETSALTWLLQQAPVIVVMGIVIWWLARQLTKKDSQLTDLSKDVIKLTALWETKAEQLTTDEKELKNRILDALHEIKRDLERLKK